MTGLPDLVLRGRRVLLPEGLREAALHVREGRIAGVVAYDEAPSGCAVFEAGDRVVMPGLVDSHVHINEPGRSDWEGFRTATRAAAAGGITTLVDMPLNSIPATTTAEALQAKRRAAEGKLWVDVGFWGGVVPGNVSELRSLHDEGVLGFKCFLVPSGVEEFVHVGEGGLREALPVLADLGAVLLVHAEAPRALAPPAGDPRRYETWMESRPPAAECEAIALLVRLAEEFGARIHVVHLAAAEAVPMLQAAREKGLPLSVETCPHYLALAAEEIRDGATLFKCAPPIRRRDNREGLWAALGAGTIDLVASDHSPAPPALKCRQSGDFLRAWGGIASLQISLPVMWTEMRARSHGLQDLARWMCAGPARLAGLRRKGTIAPGQDADFVVWDPEAAFTVEPHMLHHRHKLTPYAGRELYGLVQATFVRGRQVYHQGELAVEPVGRILKRGCA